MSEDFKVLSESELAIDLGQDLVKLIEHGTIERDIAIIPPGANKSLPNGLVLRLRSLKAGEMEELLNHELLSQFTPASYQFAAYTHKLKMVRLATQLIAINGKVIQDFAKKYSLIHVMNNTLFNQCYERGVERLEDALVLGIYKEALEEGELKNMLEGN